MESTHIPGECQWCGYEMGVNITAIPGKFDAGIKTVYASCGKCLATTPVVETEEELRALVEKGLSPKDGGDCVWCGGEYEIVSRQRHEVILRAQSASKAQPSKRSPHSFAICKSCFHNTALKESSAQVRNDIQEHKS